MTIEAKIILDSAHPQGDDYRLTTFLLRYPKFIHAEHCRHRMMSLCVSSSRAVPVSKNLEEVRSDELRAGPVYWASEQKGMSGGAELLGMDAPGWMQGYHNYSGRYSGYPTSQKSMAQQEWKYSALQAADQAERLVKIGAHKSIVNRLLEPFLHVNVLCTIVAKPGLLNFSGLRLDKAAQPEIRVLAEAMWAAWNESTQKLLQPGEWHLPFIGDDEFYAFMRPEYLNREQCMLRISTARCARLSYASFETGKRSTIEEDLKLYDRLIGSKPIHASPAEHQASPDKWYDKHNSTGRAIDIGIGCWEHPEQHGNFPGWQQHRKLLPNESMAALPEGY